MTDPVPLAIGIGGTVALIIGGTFVYRLDRKHRMGDQAQPYTMDGGGMVPAGSVQPAAGSRLTIWRGFVFGLGVAMAFLLVQVVTGLLGVGAWMAAQSDQPTQPRYERGWW